MTFLADDKEAARYPVSTTTGNMVTPAQLSGIRRAARAAGVDADAECVKVLQCRTEDLNRRAAAAFIEHLERCSVAPVAEVKS